jgi:hypothetical protein
MSGLNVVAVQDSITAHVKSEFPNYVVYDDVILDDKFILKIDNKAKPYIVLNWGGLKRNFTGASFAGARHDEYYSTVDIAIVAPTPRQARLSSNVITDRMIGWKPQYSSPMTPSSGTDVWAVENNSGNIHAYVASTRFEYAVNAENVAEYIQP